MKDYQIEFLAKEAYAVVWKKQDEGNRIVDTNKPNTKISTKLVTLSEVDAEIHDLIPNKPYIEITIGLVSVRGKVAETTVFIDNLEQANLFISEFDEVRI